jgi:RNA-binding protein
MTISSRQRAELRGQAHHLNVTVHIGHQGITDALKQSLDDALKNHELVKIQFSKNAVLTPKKAANDLATMVAADVVQAIGRTATLFRAKPN